MELEVIGLFHKILSLVRKLSQTNPVHIYFFSIVRNTLYRTYLK
jgi:hypothetical protein